MGVCYIHDPLVRESRSSKQAIAGSQKIEEPFLLAVKETLGDRYTVSLEFSYKRTISFVLRNLSEGFSQTPGQHGAEGAAT